MKRILPSSSFLARAALLLLFVFVPSINTSSFLSFFNSSPEHKSSKLYPAVFELTDDDIEWVESTLKNMTLRDKCAQMIMARVGSYYSYESSEDFQTAYGLVKDQKLGGLIFFKGDVAGETEMIAKMQDAADVPLLIASDFEHGLAMRLSDATEFPFNMAVAATGDISLAYRMAKAISAESRALGVLQNFAPVADINNNSENPVINIRAFSDDKNIVSQFCSSFIAGSKEERVLSTVKHFPGHGNTSTDSHNDIPVIYGSRESLINNELTPFVQSVKAGVQSVMIGHLSVPSLDSDHLPASLSEKIVTGILRNEIGFDGLIITDAMDMSAITNNFSDAEASIRAVKAGNDIILMPRDPAFTIYTLTTAVESGEISAERIDESVRKILAAKKWLKINEDTGYSNYTSIINSKSHIRLAEEIAEKSITMVKNNGKVIPLTPEKFYKTACITVTDGSGTDENLNFERESGSVFGYAVNTLLTRKSKPKDYNKAYELAKSSDLILLPAFMKAGSNDGSNAQINFLNKVAALKKPVIVMSFGDPYLLSSTGNVKTYLCAYGNTIVSQNAMLKAITGKTNISGILPVSIPGTDFNSGFGLKTNNSSLNFVENTENASYNFNPVDAKMVQGISDNVFPGGVVLVGRKGSVIYEKAFGKFTYENNSTPMMDDAMFDLASVSKVIGTTTAAMLLYDEGKLNIDEKVKKYLPEFGNNGKENITVRNLLVHNSGLIAFRRYPDFCRDADEVIKSIMNEKLEYPTGTKTVYSDLNMITLQKIIEKLSGKTLDKFLYERVFKPLKMERTMYNPPAEYWYYCPPTSTETVANKRNKGVVHDENAFILNGVAGHAGLFSTAHDMAIFAQMMLQDGFYDGRQIIKASTVKEWTKKQSNESTRALGWDIKSASGSSAGDYLSPTSFGHTGFTGTSIWIDKVKDLFVILLTNRVYPDRDNNKIRAFRPELHNAVMRVLNE